MIGPNGPFSQAGAPRLDGTGQFDLSFSVLRAQIPDFVAEIKTIFERWQLAEYLEKARQTEPFDASVYDDAEEAEMERQSELRRSAAELLLVERAREWLLGVWSRLLSRRPVTCSNQPAVARAATLPWRVRARRPNR